MIWHDLMSKNLQILLELAENTPKTEGQIEQQGKN